MVKLRHRTVGDTDDKLTVYWLTIRPLQIAHKRLHLLDVSNPEQTSRQLIENDTSFKIYNLAFFLSLQT